MNTQSSTARIIAQARSIFSLRIPGTFYATICDFGKLGTGFGGDMHDNVDDAVDAGIENPPFRILRIDTDPDTNLPDHVSDVTEEAIAMRNTLLRERGDWELDANGFQKEATQ